MAKKPVHFSVGLFPYDRWGGIKPIADAAKHADDLGFYGLTFPEHIVMPVRPDVPPVSVMWYDNFVLASHVATLTKRIRLIFNVMVIPYRNPVVAAKLISTLDQVSNGRLTVGVGAGWLRGEFRVLGVNAEERGPLTDEYLRAMKVLWTEANPEFRGKYVSFSRFAFEPKCVQKPHVRLWMGGSGKAPMRRVIEIGDGWAPMTGDLPDLKRDISLIKERAIAAGRDPEALDFSYSLVV
ncbi:MAG: TIGR03619 family F420-dependent LLM class oxidoreductase, partial [Chloroflexi bacterium]|nr:TIGR03619 family F420-dependent LLM class oxidoreductase [Chloroflexota bacterium]